MSLNNLKTILRDEMYSRKNIQEIFDAEKALDVTFPKGMKEFYIKYSGPFFEENLGFELKDIDEIISLTKAVRKYHKFSNKYIVLSDLVAGEILVLNSENENIYKVDFEGKDELLKNNKLNYEWVNFNSFLKSFFLNEDN